MPASKHSARQAISRTTVSDSLPTRINASMTTRILIFGNSGSGISTMARQLCRELGIPHLDLDSLAWESAGVRKTLATSIAEMEEFVHDKDDWIIEG